MYTCKNFIPNWVQLKIKGESKPKVYSIIIKKIQLFRTFPVDLQAAKKAEVMFLMCNQIIRNLYGVIKNFYVISNFHIFYYFIPTDCIFEVYVWHFTYKR